jgi:hypothetical protein
MLLYLLKPMKARTPTARSVKMTARAVMTLCCFAIWTLASAIWLWRLVVVAAVAEELVVVITLTEAAEDEDVLRASTLRISVTVV